MAALAVAVSFLLAFTCVNAQAFTLTVTGSNGTPVANYRWVIEEDATYHPVPGDDTVEALALNFHRSYMPVVMSGDSAVAADQTALSTWNPEAGKHYFISVIPKSTGMYAMGGAPIKPDETSASITLNTLPTPTAQISIFVFQDTDPINNAPDLPQEQGLAGFQINLAEAGGRFGVSGGPVTQDAFGNLLVNAALPPGEQTPGVLLTNSDGVVIIKNLPPAKYGITVSPPLGEGWVQTSTIEGSPTIDAWVKANEPPYFTEFGPAGHHALGGPGRPGDVRRGARGGAGRALGRRRSGAHQRRAHLGPSPRAAPGRPDPRTRAGDADRAAAGPRLEPGPGTSLETGPDAVRWQARWPGGRMNATRPA